MTETRPVPAGTSADARNTAGPMPAGTPRCARSTAGGPGPVPVVAMATCSRQWTHALTASAAGYDRVAAEVLATLTAATANDLAGHEADVVALAAALTDVDRSRLTDHPDRGVGRWWATRL